MASTYSNLKIQLMATGENSGTWGTVTNVNLGTAIEEAIVGSADVTFSSADVTLTLTNTNATQTARNLRLNLIGVSGGARQLLVPAIEKVYIINNGLGDTVTVKNSTGTGIAVPAGKTMYVYNNGTNVVDAITHLSSLTLGSALPAASGGTGLTSPGTSGNSLVSTGTGWQSQKLESFLTGMIIMWSGSIASIPSGWALCDGTNGTPNLTDRFVIGAGSTYAVNATGGSKDAVVVAHTHGFSATTNTTGSHTHTALRRAATFGSKNGSTGNDGNINLSNSTDIIAAAGDHSHTVSGTTNSTGSSGTDANLPPYYSLAFIMKL